METVVLHTQTKEGLIHHWKFDGNSNDSVGGNNGTDTSISYVTGKIGQAASFNGTTSEISLSNIVLTNNYTVHFWIKARATPVVGGSTNGIFNSNSINGGPFGYYNSSIYRVSFYSFQVTHEIEVLRDVWWNIVMVVENTIVKIYKNGILQSGNGVVTDSITYNRIGKMSSVYFTDVDLDDLRVYNRVISDYEIQRLYNGGRGSKY